MTLGLFVAMAESKLESSDLIIDAVHCKEESERKEIDMGDWGFRIGELGY